LPKFDSSSPFDPQPKNRMSAETTFPERLETERLILRRYCDGDALAVFALVDKNRQGLIQNFSQMARGLLKREDVESFIQEKSTQWDTRRAFCYGLWPKDAPELIGQLLVKNIVWDVPSAELSYFVGSSSQRRGFATEAISMILRVAFERLAFKRVFVRIVAANTVSFSLASKLGFKHEGLHRSEFRCGFGELHDVHYFSCTVEDSKAAL
jgi:RimJ/RimL family protein N-acetyltransferase